MKTVILLIDFKGHPALGGEYLNNRRYAEVQKILTDTQIDRSKIIFAVSKGNKDVKLEELKFMAKHLDIKYYEYDSHITFEDLQKQLMEISQQATQSSAPDSAAGGEEVIETDFSTEK